MIHQLQHYVAGQWHSGDGEGQIIHDAVTGEPIATATTRGIDMQYMLEYARNTGNPALRKLTFQERGRMLRALALYLAERKEKYYTLSAATGATRADSWIDIEGGFGNLFSYASLRRRLPDLPYTYDGEGHQLSKQGSFMAHHLLVPKEGVAIHINAYNFPIWGMLEKCAVNWLAGVPAVVKPATATSFLTEAVVKDIIASGILPEGALQLICGSAGNLLQHTGPQDVVTFTGSADTGLMLKSNPHLLAQGVPFNLEADSLNCIVLGEDVVPGMPEWDIFIKEIRREMTVKAGQKCTAIRRIMVPANRLEAVQQDLTKALTQTVLGNPRNSTVRMGALAGKTQRAEVTEQVNKLLTACSLVYGSMEEIPLVDADWAKSGSFISPLLLCCEKPWLHPVVHDVEAFGPVSTLMPYSYTEEAIELSRRGRGSLVSTIVTASPKLAAAYTLGAGPWHGRILILNAACAAESTGHGSPLPLLVHGGPGRAGGGEEMGGLRGLKHYMQRVAIQGSPDMITALTGQFQQGAAGIDGGGHPFTKTFEQLQIGEQILTGKKLITPELIESFADLSGDHFYAHLRQTDFADTMFEGQVAHGYLLMSLAAGLFVDSYQKNPVLLNYGIDELRFTKPMYPGNSLQVRFTCKEKTVQEQKEPGDIPRGIVKWLVEILDDSGELVGVATILTMVRRSAD